MVCANLTLNVDFPFCKGIEASPRRVPGRSPPLCIVFNVIVCLYSRSAFEFVRRLLDVGGPVGTFGGPVGTFGGPVGTFGRSEGPPWSLRDQH